jgi:lipoprotein NlpD
MDEETLTSKKTFIISPLKLIVGSVALLFICSFITTILLAFTPIRTLIPGYLNPEVSRKSRELLDRVEEMEKTIAAQDSFIVSLKTLGEFNYQEKSEDNSWLGTENVQEKSSFGSGNEASFNSSQLKRQSNKSNKPEFIQSEINPSYVTPVIGVISKRFDQENKHYGIDIASSKNQVVFSVTSGTVILSEWSDQTGFVIGISHPGGMVTFYKHNSKLFKKTGSYVFAGEAIAIVGNSGENSTGPHLHFEIWKNGLPADPEKYINFNP